MKKEDAIKLLSEHLNWLAENWSNTPEGRAYKATFESAVTALSLEIEINKRARIALLQKIQQLMMSRTSAAFYLSDVDALLREELIV
jgi:hypothetical protein